MLKRRTLPVFHKFNQGEKVPEVSDAFRAKFLTFEIPFITCCCGRTHVCKEIVSSETPSLVREQKFLIQQSRIAGNRSSIFLSDDWITYGFLKDAVVVAECPCHLDLVLEMFLEKNEG